MSSVFHSELPPSTARRRSLVRSGFEFDFAPVAARAFLLELPWLACSTWFNGCARTVQWKQYWKHTTRRTRSESACASAQIACSAIEAGRLASSSSCSRAHVVFCLWQVPPLQWPAPCTRPLGRSVASRRFMNSCAGVSVIPHAHEAKAPPGCSPQDAVRLLRNTGIIK